MLAAVFVAEIGDVTRFDNARAVLVVGRADPTTPRVRHHVHRGRITKQGSRLVRWAAVEAVSQDHRIDPSMMCMSVSVSGAESTRALSRRPASLCTLVFYGLRDLEVRCLDIAHPTLEVA